MTTRPTSVGDAAPQQFFQKSNVAWVCSDREWCHPLQSPRNPDTISNFIDSYERGQNHYIELRLEYAYETNSSSSPAPRQSLTLAMTRRWMKQLGELSILVVLAVAYAFACAFALAILFSCFLSCFRCFRCLYSCSCFSALLAVLAAVVPSAEAALGDEGLPRA